MLLNKVGAEYPDSSSCALLLKPTAHAQGQRSWLLSFRVMGKGGEFAAGFGGKGMSER